MPADSLSTIQKVTLVLGAAATAVSGIVSGPRSMVATGVGAALALANFWAIRRLGGRAAARVASGESVPRALPLVAALVGKMTLLFALVWVMIRFVRLPVLPFTLGLSVFVVAIVIGGLYGGTTDGREPKLDTLPPGTGSAGTAPGPTPVAANRG